MYLSAKLGVVTRDLDTNLIIDHRDMQDNCICAKSNMALIITVSLSVTSHSESAYSIDTLWPILTSSWHPKSTTLHFLCPLSVHLCVNPWRTYFVHAILLVRIVIVLHVSNPSLFCFGSFFLLLNCKFSGSVSLRIKCYLGLAIVWM